MLRIGADIIDVPRFERALCRCRTLESRIFTPGELQDAVSVEGRKRSEFLAGRFALKEATLKALGCGMFGEAGLHDVTSSAAPSGRPVIELSGGALSLAKAQGLSQADASISHDAGLAIAFVVFV